MAKSNNKTVWIVALVVIVAAVFLFGNNLTGRQIKQIGPAQSQGIIGIHPDDVVKINPSSDSIKGTELTLLNVGEGGAILVKIGQTIDTIPASSTKIVECMSIKNLATYFNLEKSKRKALIKIGAIRDLCYVAEGIFVNDYFYVAGKKVTLVNVGEGGAILVDVDDVLVTVASSKSICVNDRLIKNSGTYFFLEKEMRRAVLDVGLC